MAEARLFIIHRCTAKLISSNGYWNESSCMAFQTSDGVFHRLCGEPCRWAMQKQGEGDPPWEDGEEA